MERVEDVVGSRLGCVKVKFVTTMVGIFGFTPFLRGNIASMQHKQCQRHAIIDVCHRDGMTCRMLL